MFADDPKLIIRDLDEVNVNVICNFEAVLVLLMHRDLIREKCQALSFGCHIDHDQWVTVKSKMKVVAAIFSNNESIDKLNSDLVSKCFFNTLQKSYGIKGTILQKVHFVNTFLFSKLWYSAQCFKMDNKNDEKIAFKGIGFYLCW